MQRANPDHPAVSVVVPLFNKAATVARALDSILRQTVSDLEVVVVDDGSTDSSAAIARSFADPRVRVIDQENRGVGAARNRGIAEARSDLIALLDADDVWERDYLEVIFGLRDAFPGSAVYATSYWIHGARGARRAVLSAIPVEFRRGLLPQYFRIASVSDPPLCSSSVSVARHAIEAVGGVPEGVTAGEDLLTWARLAARFEIAYAAVPKAHFFGPNRVSDRPGRVPQVPDRVADGLSRLLAEADPNRTHGLREYHALWHRMRAVIYLHLGDGRSSRTELRRALALSASGRLVVLCLIATLPWPVSVRVFRALQQARRALQQ